MTEGAGSTASQCTEPHLEDGSAYGRNGPTCLSGLGELRSGRRSRVRRLTRSQGEMHIRRIPSNRGRTDFNVRAVELYLAAATRTHHLRNVDPTLALV